MKAVIRTPLGLILLAASALAQTVDFDRQIHPILAERCLACHTNEKRSGGLSLASYAAVLDGGRSGATVKPGQSAASLLIARVNGETEPRMPVGLPPLAPAEIAVLRKWIDEGARRAPSAPPAKPKWEAPLGLMRPPDPPVTWKGWDSTIDRHVAAYLAAAGVREPEAVSDIRFARRAYLDIHGLLPPLDVRVPQQRSELVARLLADRKTYAGHWISFWNDLLRNDEGVNYHSETASRKSISDWLIGSLESNRPYDEWVKQLLNPGEKGPDGFLVGVNWRGVVNASQVPAMQAAQNTAQIFLGINVKCNSCHDSFISRWKLKDAYSLAAYFAPEAELQLYRCDAAIDERAGPGFLFPELNRRPISDSLDDRRAAAAAIFTDARNGRLARTVVNRIWQRLLGHGIVANPDEMDEEPWSPQLLDALAADFAAHGFDLQWLTASIINSRAYQMPTVVRANEQTVPYAFRGPEVRRLTAEQFGDAIGALTGEWPVHPGTSERTREWRVAATPLARALGRPIRDQVYSTRESRATTLQALEMVNGETLTHRLLRGARRMLNKLPPAPAPLFDKGYNGRGDAPAFDVDITGASRIWLLLEDTGSYSPEKIEAIWKDAELVSGDQATPLASLQPLRDAGLRAAARLEGVPVKTPSELVYDLGGRGFTRLRGTGALENREITSDLNPRIRFLVFRDEPDRDEVTPAKPGAPLPAVPRPGNAAQAAEQVFHYALGRAPTPAEARAAQAALTPLTPEALADLLWAVLAKPEFQLIY